MNPTVLVTGATGYIGGRLVPELLTAGFKVRCLARDPDRLRDHGWTDRVERVRGDVLAAQTLRPALAGVDVAFYLVHSLTTGAGFEQTEDEAARNFATAAKDAGVSRIVYLGGMAPQDTPVADLSPHLRSRVRVGQVFRACGIPTVELRAAVVIGSGSASFEMLRYLTERLPVMVTPRWVGTRIQPIAVRDVLRYLVGAAVAPDPAVGIGGVFDIGGPDVLTYREMMLRYARLADLPRRLIVAVPVLTPGLSSQWVGAVTPVPASIARPLVESLRHEVVCGDRRITELVPDPPEGLLGFDGAVRLARTRVREAAVTTRWSSASMPGAPSDPLPTDPAWAGGSLYRDLREAEVDIPAERVWRVVESIGGETGWYSFPLAWAIRGWLDRMVGGIGLRRGRRDPETLRLGDTLDFWRVEALEPGHLLRLRAEMKLPGLAWLEMRVEPTAGGRTRYRQRALFFPHGLFGHLYWWSVAPFHAVVFGGMVRNLLRRAAQEDPGGAS
ncbi:SDR family oxidoreductase [Catenulispora sp. NL8]|uniref:SDR family oxidoreductase n=1 Tax=Catenulispora pinistramenti TaxID=2705254 RepID=A0ABS5KRL7_9ACTN|nr:SDR family oxidoreductase [Catenulispora pinistramenti]MBS2548692.1 SDR family oxidoreductase [Catenulispora pinistramenti]